MESKTELIKMIGTQGQEDVILFDNCYYDPNMFEDMLFYTPKKRAAYIRKNSTLMVHTWIWVKQSTRFDPNGWTLVKSDDIYTLKG